MAYACYGRSHEFREWLEEQERPYAVMAPKTNAVPLDSRKNKIEQLVEQLPEDALPPQSPIRERPYYDHRTVLGGILWVARTGSSWRETPREFGKWETAYRRYELWVNQGLWPRILRALGEEDLPGPATEKPN